MEDRHLLALGAGLQPAIVNRAQLRSRVEVPAGRLFVDNQLAADPVTLIAARPTLGADIVPSVA